VGRSVEIYRCYVCGREVEHRVPNPVGEPNRRCYHAGETFIMNKVGVRHGKQAEEEAQGTEKGSQGNA
jgi:hypothetical protein